MVNYLKFKSFKEVYAIKKSKSKLFNQFFEIEVNVEENEGGRGFLKIGHHTDEVFSSFLLKH